MNERVGPTGSALFRAPDSTERTTTPRAPHTPSVLFLTMSRFKYLLPLPGAPEAHLRAGSKKGGVSPAPAQLSSLSASSCASSRRISSMSSCRRSSSMSVSLLVVSLTGVIIPSEDAVVNLTARKKSQKSLAMELTTIGNAPMMNLVRTTTERN